MKIIRLYNCLLIALILGCSDPGNNTVNTYKVVQKAITVDANSTDWQGIKAESINRKDHLWIGQGMLSDNWKGQADLSFIWRAAYNNNKLYFLYEVTDNTISPFDRANTWLNDCIELCLDPKYQGGMRKDTVNGNISLNGYEMHFLPSSLPHAYMCDDQSLYVVTKPQDEEFKNKWKGQMAVKYTDSGYIMEIAFMIPDIKFEKGKIFGFETAICDDDGNSRKNLMTWTGIQTNYWISMDKYGKLIIK